MDAPARHEPFWRVVRHNRNALLLAGTVFCVGGGFGVQIPLFANFILERFSVRTQDYGFLEALRETPGFLTAFFAMLTMLIAAPRLGMGSLLIMGVGIGAYAWIVPIANLLGGSALFTLMVTSVFWSVGFHSWSPIEGTLSLRFAPTAQTGRWLGWLRTSSAVGQLSLMGIALVLIRLLDYEGMFFLAGCLILVGAVLIGLTRDAGQANPSASFRERRFLLRPRYAVYYVLIFLQGARKQLFLMFAVWLLVRGQGAPRELILSLMLVNQVLGLLTAPTMGRLVDRFGERATLAVSHAALFAVMFGYAFLRNTILLSILYILDSLLFVGGIALTTYLNKIAPKEDIRPTLTMGVTMNHIPSVLVPLIGGILWDRIGATTVFLMGAGFALASLVATQWVRPDRIEAVPFAAEPAD